MKQKNIIFSINNKDRKKMFKEMYLDYRDPHITHVMKVGTIKGNKYEKVIGYDEDDREYILNMKWCENRFTSSNVSLMFLQRIKVHLKVSRLNVLMVILGVMFTMKIIFPLLVLK